MSDIPTIPEMNEEAQKAWPAFSEKFSLGTPEKFYRAMTEGLPRGTELKVNFDRYGDLNSVNYNFKDGEDRFSFMRDFVGPYVTHLHADVSPGLRGSGIGRIVNGHLFRLYQKIGIKRIDLYANDLGSYVWARSGFVPSPESWAVLQEHVGRRLDFFEKEAKLPYGCVKALRAALSSADPKSFWFIVDQQYPCYGAALGKLLTFPADKLPKEIPWPKPEKRLHFPGLKTKKDIKDIKDVIIWGGTADLKDPACLHRMIAYLFPEGRVQPFLQSKPSACQPSARGAS